MYFLTLVLDCDEHFFEYYFLLKAVKLGFFFGSMKEKNHKQNQYYIIYIELCPLLLGVFET